MADPNAPTDPLRNPDGAANGARPGLATPDSRAPASDTYPLGSGGSGSAANGGSEGDNLDVSGTRQENSISGEPNRVQRGGAAGKTLDECMAIWDPSTHMSEAQWKTTCERLGR